MYEMYGFIAAFTAQILVFSVFGPLRLASGLRGQISRFIAERRPAIDPLQAAQVDRRLRLFRALGLGTAVIGLVLLVAMIRYMLRPDWRDGPLEAVVPAYWIVQLLPAFLAVWTADRFHRALKRALPPQKRKAILQPRGLFDFVSRSALAVAVLVYFLFILLLLYIEKNPFPGFAGVLTNAGIVALIYFATALAIHVTLRNMASSPLQAREERLHSVGLAVRIYVYTCTLIVMSLSLNMSLTLLDEQRWEPTLASIWLIAIGLLMRKVVRQQMHIPAGTGPASPALSR